ncbi:uncharacterized protein LOC113794066 [Dermatophagoides pteronyssinus]|uniref:uncharacterized protein LOC113794066 n=1 Tax=Dermatophagoides pteronyssinus TaxID=6956 RepID=UPI003F6723D5
MLLMKLAFIINIILRIPIETTETQKDEICENLKKKGTKFNILAVGRTSKQLILLTADFFVYDVPIDSIDTSIDKLYLRTKPKPLKDKYPGFYNSPYFQNVKHYIFNAWIMKDEEGDWICITTRARNHMDGVSYLINNDEAVKGWIYYDQATEVLISQNQQCRYYSLRHYGGNNLIIGLYQCDQGRSRVRYRPHIGLVYKNFSAICYDETKTKITIEMMKPHEPAQCRSGIAVQWPVLKGFVSEGKFYLFGEAYIYIFDESVYLRQGQQVAVRKHSYDSFFSCAGFVPASQELSKSYFYWIIAAIILLLLILSMLLWFILINRRRQRIKSSLIHGKTGRSAINSPMNLSKMTAKIASTKSRKSMAQAQKMNSSRNVMASSRANNVGHNPLSGGSARLTARTGLAGKIRRK